ncbi:unnamed protein product [Amaranthus hypochondriacus]
MGIAITFLDHSSSPGFKFSFGFFFLPGFVMIKQEI